MAPGRITQANFKGVYSIPAPYARNYNQPSTPWYPVSYTITHLPVRSGLEESGLIEWGSRVMRADHWRRPPMIGEQHKHSWGWGSFVVSSSISTVWSALEDNFFILWAECVNAGILVGQTLYRVLEASDSGSRWRSCKSGRGSVELTTEIMAPGC